MVFFETILNLTLGFLKAQLSQNTLKRKLTQLLVRVILLIFEAPSIVFSSECAFLEVVPLSFLFLYDPFLVFDSF